MMSPKITLLVALLLLALLPMLRAEQDDFEPPAVGRPPNFSDAVGSFRVTTRAEPTELLVEQPLTFTIRVTAEGPVKRPPARPDLKVLPEFADRFYIEDVADPPAPPGGAWEFVYRLKPKGTQVREIPAFPFVFYKPGVLPPSKGYQTDYADKIPLNVKPAAVVGTNDVQGMLQPVQAPAWLYAIPQGESVLRSHPSGELPPWLVLLLLSLAPPALCAGWYVLWVRAHPDLARQARQRRSRAARQALQVLQNLDRLPTEERAAEAAVVVANYLRERTDLCPAQPTPAEAAAHLTCAGASRGVVEKVSLFFTACDDARYGPDLPRHGEDWRAVAAELIVTLEAEPWPSSVS